MFSSRESLMKHSKDDRKKPQNRFEENYDNHDHHNDYQPQHREFKDKKNFKGRPDRDFRKPYAVQEENPELGNFKKLLDHFYLSANTPFDANLYTVLLQLAERVRLNKSQREWLLSHSKDVFYNSAVHRAFHLAEGKWYLDEYANSFDPLSLISAADHYVEAKLPETAVEGLMEHSKIAENKNNKVVAFYFNTLASAYRELREFRKGYEAAQKAYEASCEEERTALLLGSLALHIGEPAEAVKWYVIAIKNGASKLEADEDLKATVKVMSASLRFEAVKYLYSKDAERYGFLRGVLPKKQRGSV